MVCPGTKNVDGMSRRARIFKILGTAIAPNSPRDTGVGSSFAAASTAGDRRSRTTGTAARRIVGERGHGAAGYGPTRFCARNVSIIAFS